MGTLGYVPALDGVRGVAIVIVLAAHAALWSPGGLVGVDLFFVLSGFLITRLLLDEHARTGGISLREFYRRRALRLLPALALLFAVFGAFNPRGVLYGALYVTNVAKIFGEDPHPFGHLWSLSVEEHFYFVWPVLLLLLLRRGERWALGATAGALLLAVLWQVGLSVDPYRMYLGTDTRAAGLLIGCLAGFLTHRGLRVSGSLGWFAAIAAIGMAATGWLSADIWNGRLLLFEAAVAVALVALLNGGRLSGMLSASPLTYLGRISYGLYLWHVPVFLAFDVDGSSPGLMVVAAAAVSVVVAALSRRCVEAPFLRRKERPRKSEVLDVEMPVSPVAATG